MAERLNVNKFEYNQNRIKTLKESEGQKVERYKRDNYDRDIENLDRRDEDNNNALLWGCVLGFLLFIVIFVLIVIFTV